MGLKFRDFIDEAITRKTGIRNTTFKELKEVNLPESKDVYLIATNINTARTEIFSYEHTPNAVIADAVRASISIPFMFTPWSLQFKDSTSQKPYSDPRGFLYVDGGLNDNFAVWLFDQRRYYVKGNTLLEGEDEEDDSTNTEFFNTQTIGLRIVSSRLKQVYSLSESISDSERQMLSQQQPFLIPSNIFLYTFHLFKW
jgi:NTE family protein